VAAGVLGGVAGVVWLAVTCGALVAASPERAEEAPELAAGATGEREAQPTPTVPPTAPDGAPGEWDPQVAELVEFLEGARELEFQYPVPVEMLEEEDYVEASGGEGDDGSYGFFDGERVVVRGTEFGIDVQGTLVHELTHALDNQYYDIFAVDADGTLPPQARDAYNILVEGNAVRMEVAYMRQLAAEGVDTSAAVGIEVPDVPPPGPTGTGIAESAARHVASGQADERHGSDAGLPPTGEGLDDAPYDLGGWAVDTLALAEGTDAVNALFEEPPTTTEQIIDPRALATLEPPVEVDAPVPSDPDGPVGRPKTIGALDLFLVLSTAIDPMEALDAATGWGGDAAVVYTKAGGVRCTDLAVVGDTDADTEELATALTAWAEAAPDASVATEGGTPTLTTCQGVFDEPRTEPILALAAPMERLYQTWEAVLLDDVGVEEAFDTGECVIDAVSFDTVLSTSWVDDPPESAQSEIDAASDDCEG
jgi:hypothetical protein